MHAHMPTRQLASDTTLPRRRWADPRRHPGSAIAAAVEMIRQLWCESLGTATPPQPRVAVILGTGLGRVANAIDIDAEIPYREIPPFVAPTAVSHQGRLILGRLDGVTTLAFAGRVHVYEGHGLRQVVLPVDVAAALGATALIASNAGGGLKATYRAGDVVVIDDHIDLMFAAPRASHTPRAARDETGRPGNAADVKIDNVKIGNVYDREMIELALRSARVHGGSVHRGVYAAVPGPNYETRAEIRMLRKIGADVVGMSTVPEVVAARQLGLRVAALSVVTNQCNPDRAVHVTGNEVAESAAGAEQLVSHIVRDLVAHVGAGPVSR